MLKGLTQKTLSHSPVHRFGFGMCRWRWSLIRSRIRRSGWVSVQPRSATAAAEQGVNIVSLQPVSAMRPVADAYWNAAGSDALASGGKSV